MHFSSFLFVQLPAFISNLTNPSSSSSTATTTTAVATSSIATAQLAPAINYNMTKYELPPLPYAYNALEPYISEQIMKLHHTKHHQAYVTNLNAALDSHVKALSAGDVKAQITLQQAVKFHGGGHLNHALFWPSLTPASSPAADISKAPTISRAITEHFGSMDGFKGQFKTLLLGIQGSGWGWLVKNAKGGLELATTKDQDPVTGDKVVVFGVDMWEHAYYLQYWNDKASYVDGVWMIINWETAEARFTGKGGAVKL